MNSLSSATLALVALGLTSLACADEKEHAEEHMKLEQLPAAVQSTVKQEGAQVKEIERETENGQSFYEVTFAKGKDTYELHIADSGKILKRETEEND